MITKTSTFIKFLMMGYTFIILLTFFIAFIFFNYEKNISLSLVKHAKNIELQEVTHSLKDSAIQRSIFLVKMLRAENKENVAYLRFKMDQQSNDIIRHLAIFKDQVEIISHVEFNEIKHLIELTTITQQQVYNLIITDQPNEALTSLVKYSLPKQRELLNKLKTAEEIIGDIVIDSRKYYTNLVQQMRLMILLSAMSIILSLLLVAFFSVRKLRVFNDERRRSLTNLNKLIKQHKQELLLDKQLMHNLSEATGVFDSNQQVIISNKKFTKLISKEINSKNLTIWQYLDCIFENIDIEKIKNTLSSKNKYRGEAKLISYKDIFMIINVFLIKDEKLDNYYYAVVLTDITELKNTHNKLIKIANNDEVTQLPNRGRYNDHINNLITKYPNNNFTVLFLDLDNFKWVNDNYGHEIGDKFLYDFGQMVLSYINKKDSLFRIGGDEFTIVIKGQVIDDKIFTLANALISNIQKITINRVYKQEVGCSIGIASYPQDSNTAAGILTCADYAMYKIKKLGKNKFSKFTDAMKAEIQYLKEIEKKLKSSVKKQQFEVHYQPQFAIQTLKLIGAEALLRWPQNNKGVVSFIPPYEFIPLAEQFGLIDELGKFVFEQSVAQLAKWQKVAKPLPRVAINVSAIQLLAGGFGGFVIKTLVQNNIPASMVDIEITESVMMDNIESMSKSRATSLRFLQEKGLEISIDDFGTGYSSLAYIKYLGVDRIKIDKSFIDDIEHSQDARAIVKAIIEMGHNIGVIVLAEGIETEAQLKVLQDLNCDEGQGYLFSKPLDVKTFELKFLS